VRIVDASYRATAAGLLGVAGEDAMLRVSARRAATSISSRPGGRNWRWWPGSA
jgi:hypothetical protein